MCGIFGIAFRNETQQGILNQLFTGLEALEYRGYDSAGIAVQMSTDPIDINLCKSVGRTAALRLAVEESILKHNCNDSVQGGVAVAHTRWATHGPATHNNAHPHTCVFDDVQFAVVHNGIVTNHADLREFLTQKNYRFYSDTDTEVIAVLCSYVYRTHFNNQEINFAELVHEVTCYLDGAYAILFMCSLCPNQLVATKRGSPLIVGVRDATEQTLTFSAAKLQRRHTSVPFCTDQSVEPLTAAKGIAGEAFYFSSDSGALAPHVLNVLYMEDGMIAHVDRTGQLVLYCCAAKNHVNDASASVEEGVSFVLLDARLETISKHGYADYMLKEIMEQPESVGQTLAGRLGAFSVRERAELLTESNDDIVVGKPSVPHLHLGGLDSHWKYIEKSRRLILVGCGTSHNAALVVRGLLETSARRPVQVELASDFLDRRPPIYRDDVCIFISQSGETADTLQALHYCRTEGDALCLGIVNTIGSSIARLTDCGIHLNCGKEIGVASTKAYTSQIVALVLISLRLWPDPLLSEALVSLPQQIRETIQLCRTGANRFAKRLFDEQCHSLLLLGRAQQYATCREGALKIKEIAYVNTEAIASGELKHGSVALVDANAHMLVIATHDDVQGKVRTAISQLMARGGRPFVITDDTALITEYEHQCRDCLLVPKSKHPALQCILNVLPLQLIAYDLAKLLGHDVDKPRNLAKSVTVE